MASKAEITRKVKTAVRVLDRVRSDCLEAGLLNEYGWFDRAHHEAIKGLQKMAETKPRKAPSRKKRKPKKRK